MSYSLLRDFGGEKYSPRRDRKNLYQISQLYTVTLLDPSFQRLGGVFNGSGWTYANACCYLNSILEGSVENKIILAHVKDCLRHAEDIGDQKSIIYFARAKDEGCEYVSIDGNNTSSAVYAWLQGISVGTKVKNKKETKIFLRSSELEKRIPVSCGLFTELEMVQQQEISASEKLDVTVYHTITIDEMCSKFRKTNTQTSLNPQEYRQARKSNMADYIRRIAKENRELFENLVLSKSSSFDKRVPDEMLAQLVMFLSSPSHSTDLLKKNLDSFYNTVFEISPEIKSTTERLLSESLKISNALPKLTTKLSRADMFSMWYFIYILQTAGYRISDEKKFFNWFCKINMLLEEHSGDLPSKESEDHSYKEWVKRYNQSIFYRKTISLFEEIVEEHAPAQESSGSIKKERTGKDVLTKAQRRKLIAKQRFLDRNGSEITPLDFYRGALHADHRVSVRDGGSTTISNGEMMRASDNLKKGPQSFEPHFPHQAVQENVKITVDTQ